MDRDPLIEMLKRADAAAPAPKLQLDLAGRIRRRVLRNRRLAVFSAGASVAAAAAVVVIAIRLTPTGVSGATTPDRKLTARHLNDSQIAVLRSEIAQLDREADALSAVVRLTMELERGARGGPSRRALVTDARDDARRQSDTAACMAVLQATRLEATSGSVAATAYREVVSIFPNTPWAEQARRRLAALSGHDGGSS